MDALAGDYGQAPRLSGWEKNKASASLDTLVAIANTSRNSRSRYLGSWLLSTPKEKMPFFVVNRVTARGDFAMATDQRPHQVR